MDSGKGHRPRRRAEEVMDAFEKWKPVNGYGVSSLDAIAEQAFRAGKAEGIKEGMQTAAEIADQHASVEGIAQRIRDAILKEIGE